MDYGPHAAADSELVRAVRAFAAHYAGLLALHGSRLHGLGSADGGRAQSEAIRLLLLEQENLLEAFGICLSTADAQRLEPFAEYLSVILGLAGEAALQLRCYQQLEQQSSSRQQLALRVQLGQASAFERLGGYDKAQRAANAALALALEMTDGEGQAASQLLLGNLDYRQGDYAGAVQRFSLVLELRHALGDRRNIAVAHNSLGMALAACGEEQDGLAHCRLSLEMREEVGDRHGAAAASNNIGVILLSLGESGAARECYLRCLELKQDSGDRLGVALALNNLGNIDYRERNFEAALQYFRRSLALVEELGHRYGQAMAQDNLGRCTVQLGELEAARLAFASAIRLRLALGSTTELAHSLSGAALVLVRLGQLEAAAQLLYGARARLAEAAVPCGAEVQSIHELVDAELESALTAGRSSPLLAQRWRDAGEKAGLPRLAQLALTALADSAQAAAQKG